MINSKEHEIFCVSLRDKFGAYGIIGLVFLKHIEKSIHIENFLMSCRALGRKVESALLSFVEMKYKKNGFLKVIGRYKKSKKNIIVKNFFTDHGYSKKGIFYYKDLNNLKNNKFLNEIKIIYGK